MAKDNNKTAYIGIEREENSLKYIAKVFNEPPCQITKAQYNAIVKALREQDWANNVEDEASVISKIISSNLETTDSSEL
jgi:tRNA G46 methylase TrmB